MSGLVYTSTYGSSVSDNTTVANISSAVVALQTYGVMAALNVTGVAVVDSLGVGTSSLQNNLVKLENTGVNTGISLSDLSKSAGQCYVGITNTQDGSDIATSSGFQGMSLGAPQPGSGASGYLAFHTHYAGISSGEKMRVDKSGNVGIATTAPAEKLDVVGNIRASNGLYASGGANAFLELNVTNQQPVTIAQANAAGAYSNSALIGDLVIRAGSTSNRVIVQSSSGNAGIVVANNGSGVQRVGINNSSPQKALDITGDCQSSGNISGASVNAGASGLTVTGTSNVSTLNVSGALLSVYGPGASDASNTVLIQNNASHYGRNEIKLIGRAELAGGSINDGWSFSSARNAISFNNQTQLNAAVDRRYVIQLNGASNEIGILSNGQGDAPIVTWNNSGLMTVNNGMNLYGGANVSGTLNTAAVSASSVSASSVSATGNVSGLSLNAGASGLSVSGSSSLAGVSAGAITASSLAATGNVSGLTMNASGLSVSGLSDLTSVNAHLLNATSIVVTNTTGISGQGVVQLNVTALGGSDKYVNGVYSRVTIDSAFGGTTAADISTVQCVRGRVQGSDLSKAGINVSAIRADYDVTGSNAAQMKTAVLAAIQPGTSTADAAVIAYIEGDSGVAHAESAYAVRMANSTAGSGFQYGLNLEMLNIVNGPAGAPNVAFDTADIRLNNGLLIKSVTSAVANNDGAGGIAAGTVVMTSNATGLGKMFISDGTNLKQLAFV